MLRERIFSNWLFRLRPGSGRVLLTFDDGPDPDSTPRLIDALQALNINAVHFLTGERCKKFPAIVHKLSNTQQQIGNHGYEHSSFLCHRVNTVAESIRQTDLAIRLAGGTPLNIFRPPYGRFNPWTARALTTTNCRGILWSALGYDWIPNQSARVRQRVLRALQDGVIIALHDTPVACENVLPLLPEFAATAQSLGLHFARLNETDLSA